ncbi:MAG TPA: hypothetical protein VEL07_18660 [Planctomycetota bacterium]|nr:hypothetical protein [Planctomycetota bacterium]
MIRHITRPATSRGGFTLFEVAIALLIVAIAVLSVALTFPIGIKAQRLARFQIYAGTKMMEMVDTFAQAEHAYWMRSVEAREPWQNPFMSTPVDFDQMMSDGGFGLLPLPDAIARRIDSDDHEIARLLDEGGRLYYPAPHPFTLGFDARHPHAISGRTEPVPVEAQTLVWGVTGFAQQNVLPSHPCLAWPYIATYPSPIQEWDWFHWNENRQAAGGEFPSFAAFDALWECDGTRALSAANFANLIGDASIDPVSGQPRNRALITRAMDLAQELVFTHLAVPVDTTIPSGDIPVGRSVPIAPAALPRPGEPTWDPVNGWDASDPDLFPPPWRVAAINWLAVAAQAFTSPAMPAPAGGPTDAAKEQRYAQLLHDRCLQWATRYAAVDPYDWGALRPLNHQHAWQHPLLQFDLFPDGAANLGVLSGTAGDEAGDTTWRVVGGGAPRRYGPGRGHQGYHAPMLPGHINQSAIRGSWGDQRHFNATARFAPAERARTAVCWSVDWRAYRDFESQPAAPLAAKRYRIDSAGRQVAMKYLNIHPEFIQFWMDDPLATPPAALQTAVEAWDWTGDPNPDADAETTIYRARRLGCFGADRNGNSEFDQGPVPPTTRMRAVGVGRFVFYDRRTIASLRF